MISTVRTSRPSFTRDRRKRRVTIRNIVMVLVGLLLSTRVARASEAECAALAGGTIPASVIGLPGRGGQIAAATYATQENVAYCKILGKLAPIDPTAPDINFEVNLPATWNSKAIQYGGAGLNGSLVTGLSALRDAPPGPTPLALGYMTFGTDGGHQAVKGQDPQAFASNREALLNYAYGAYKKTHDAALYIARTYYGRGPVRMYFIGSSEGGREAMLAAQRFPADYEGIVAIVPALDWVGVSLTYYRLWQDVAHGGWLNPSKLALVQRESLASCDSSDGLRDGVIMRYRGCPTNAGFQSLRCAGGKDLGDDCLSDGQLRLVSDIRSPFAYGFPIAHGETTYPAYPVGGEANRGALNPWLLAATPPTDEAARSVLGVGNVRYFIARDPEFSVPLDLRAYHQQIQAMSKLMDVNDPDISTFSKRGGKLVIKENAADYLISPETVFRYYESVVRRLGRRLTDSSVRLYVAPWTTHGGAATSADGQPVPSKVDLLSALDAWVESGEPPTDPLTLNRFDGVAVTAAASLPLCRYPFYPQFIAGSPKDAASYRCNPVPSEQQNRPTGPHPVRSSSK